MFWFIFVCVVLFVWWCMSGDPPNDPPKTTDQPYERSDEEIAQQDSGRGHTGGWGGRC